MRCNQARRMLERRAVQDLGPREAQSLASHLGSCPECSKLEDQLNRTWDALGLCHAVEPSPEFLPRLKARLSKEESVPQVGWLWQVGRRWQWVAVACCFLLAAILLTRSDSLRRQTPPAVQSAKVGNGDRSDEQFLQKLEDTLQQSAEDYLSTYDTWPSVIGQGASLESPEVKPAATTVKKGAL